jgi:hypothetical protein
MKKVFRICLLLAGLFVFNGLNAQIEEPVKWKLSTKKVSDCEYELLFTGTIEEHWHVYSLIPSIGDETPNPAKINVDKNPNYEIVGKPTEGKPIKVMDKVFETNVAYFEHTVTFKQKIRLKTDKEVVVTGNYEYQACTEEKCIFPQPEPFEFKLKGTADCANQAAVGTPTAGPCEIDSAAIAAAYNANL